MTLKDLPVHMFWAEGNLSQLARLSLASFVRQGYRVKLWSFDGVAAPGAEACDARQVVAAPADDLANMAWLSSLFRYRVLAEQGGIWSDTDVVALAENPGLDAAPLVASEKRRPFRHGEPTATGEGMTQVTNCFMANPKPQPGDLFHRAAERVSALASDRRSWENVGPHLLSRLMLDHPGHGVTILPTDAVDPVAWWNVPGYFLEARDPPPSPFMHMYATIWAKRGVDAEAAFPAGSLVERLRHRFGP